MLVQKLLSKFSLLNRLPEFFGHIRKMKKNELQLRHAYLSVYLSVHMEKLGSHCTDFRKILLRIFQKSV